MQLQQFPQGEVKGEMKGTTAAVKKKKMQWSEKQISITGKKKILSTEKLKGRGHRM